MKTNLREEYNNHGLTMNRRMRYLLLKMYSFEREYTLRPCLKMKEEKKKEKSQCMFYNYNRRNNIFPTDRNKNFRLS